MLMAREMVDGWPNKFICVPTVPQHVVHRCPVYYREKILEVWLALTPPPPLPAKENMQTNKTSHGRFLKIAAITLSNFKWPQLQHMIILLVFVQIPK